MILGRILAIDFGNKRLGFALSDPSRIIAYSYATIDNLSQEKIRTQIQQVVKDQEVSRIVVGLPVNLKGEEAQKAESVRKFITRLRQWVPVEVVTYDERFTTTMAHQTIKSLGKSPSRERKKIDQIAATILLQSYLDYIKNQNGNDQEK